MAHIFELKQTELMVYGWIREAEKKLNIGYVPTDIKRICAAFAILNDAFDYIGEELTISLDGKSVTKTEDDSDYTECYGYYGISPHDDKCKYKWDILIKNLNSRHDPIIIGISSYLQQEEDGLEYYYNCETQKDGDTMSVSIDLYYKTISYSRNNMIQFFDNLISDNWNKDTVFRLQIRLARQGDSAEIKNFSMLHR